MKVLHIAEKAQGGGAESVFRNTITALASEHPENVYWVACVKDSQSSVTPDLDFGKPPQKKIYLLFSQIYSFQNYRKLTAFLSQHHPDVIHVQNYGNLSPSILRALWQYKKKHPIVRIIQTVHTFEYACSHYSAYDYRKQTTCLDCAHSTFKLKIFFRRCSRAGFLHSYGKGVASLIANYYINKGVFDLFITPSEFLRKVMLKRSLKGREIFVVRNPLPDNFFKKQVKESTVSLPTEQDPIRIVYFGRFSEEKNLGCLLNAFHILTQKKTRAVLTLIGDGEEKAQLLKLCNQLGINEKVVFCGFLNSGELYTEIKKHHIAVLPSKCFETASLLVCEAITANLVPIVANHGGMKEMVEWIGAGATFKSDDELDLAFTLHDVYENYERYIEKLPQAIIKSEYQLNLRKYVNELLHIYNSL
jgi:glycosyltransferase involved in cell wall biosynthesis